MKQPQMVHLFVISPFDDATFKEYSDTLNVITRDFRHDPEVLLKEREVIDFIRNKITLLTFSDNPEKSEAIRSEILRKRDEFNHLLMTKAERDSLQK